MTQTLRKPRFSAIGAGVDNPTSTPGWRPQPAAGGPDRPAAEAPRRFVVLLGRVRDPPRDAGDGEDRGGRLGWYPRGVGQRAEREVNVERPRRCPPRVLDDRAVLVRRDLVDGFEQRRYPGIAVPVDRVAEPADDGFPRHQLVVRPPGGASVQTAAERAQ